MRLNIFKTNTTLEGSRGLIRQLERQNADNVRHFFIVPDRFTLSFEQEICEKVFPDGCYNVDVVSFTRLAVKLLGDKLNKCLSKEGTVILLNKVIKQNNDKLVYYKDLNSYSISKELFAAIASFRDSKITSADILSSVKSMEGVTREKLKDIALLYNAYNEELQTHYVDTITRVDSLTENVKNLTVFSQSHIYIFGFNIYSAQQLKLIKELAKYCMSVNITFAVDSGGINHSNFITHQMDELRNFCMGENIVCNEIESTELLNPPFYQLHKNMFGYTSETLKLPKESRDKVILYAQSNPYEEIRGVAREINYLVKKNNYRYKDVAVVICADTYKRIIEEIFTRCGIPFFVDSKYFVKDSFAVKYINALFDAVSENYAIAKMCKLAHNPLVGLTRKQIESFENYIVKYSIDYTRFLQPFDLGEYADAEKVRQILINLLIKVPKGKNTISEYVQYAIRALAEPYVTEKLELYSQSEDVRLSVSAQAEDFVNVLTEIAELNGENTVTADSFINIYNSAIADMGKGVLPQYVDSVFVGNTSDSRFNNILALFVVGASSGNFPSASGDNVIISAYDNEVMKKGGLKIYPTPLDNNNMERLVVIDLLVKPRERLYVGYSKNDITGETMLIGEALSELMHLFNVDKLQSIADIHNFSEEELVKYSLINPQNAYYEYIRHNIPDKYSESIRNYLIDKGYGDKLRQLENKCDDNINYTDYFFKRNGDKYNTSVSQLESYFKCPFYHFCKYGLKLKEREEGFLKVNIVGDIIHKILEYYFKKYTVNLRSASEDQIKGYINQTIEIIMNSPDYEMYKADGMGRYSMDNLAYESRKLLLTLSRYVKQSDFTPTYIEMGFGRNDGDKTINVETDGKKFNFVGKVDRVDTFDNKVAIIDYKTGSVEEDYKYIYYGKKLQLYLYLKVFLDEGKTPAGVFYMPIKSNYNKDGVSYKLAGQISNDIDTFAQLDNGFTGVSDYSSEMLDFNVKYINKDKLFKISGKNAIDKENFCAISDYVLAISKIALGEISAGYRERKPFKDSCKWCAYRNMCGEITGRTDTGVDGINSFLREESDEQQT